MREWAMVSVRVHGVGTRSGFRLWQEYTDSARKNDQIIYLLGVLTRWPAYEPEGSDGDYRQSQGECQRRDGPQISTLKLESKGLELEDVHACGA